MKLRFEDSAGLRVEVEVKQNSTWDDIMAETKTTANINAVLLQNVKLPASPDQRLQGKARVADSFQDVLSLFGEDDSVLEQLSLRADYTGSLGDEPKVAMLFAGQGTQNVGMCEELAASQVGKDLFQRASQILGYDLLQLCNEGPDERLQQTAYSQPAVMVTSLAAAEKWRLLSPKESTRVVACAGFSLGEFSALVYSGAISFEDGVRLVKARSEAMQQCAENSKGAMASVAGMEDASLNALLQQASAATGKNVRIANYLFPKGRTISGDEEAVEWICGQNGQRAKDAGASNAKRIKTSGAFHTVAMAGAQDEVARMLETINIKLPRDIKVYSNVTGKPYTDVKEMRELLKRQVAEPVLWEDTIRAICEDKGGMPNKFLETGPGQQLKAMLKRTNPQAFANCEVLK